jgi:hypothetical protein
VSHVKYNKITFLQLEPDKSKRSSSLHHLDVVQACTILDVVQACTKSKKFKIAPSSSLDREEWFTKSKRSSSLQHFGRVQACTGSKSSSFDQIEEVQACTKSKRSSSLHRIEEKFKLAPRHRN